MIMQLTGHRDGRGMGLAIEHARGESRLNPPSGSGKDTQMGGLKQ
jgi:hypothetical protein